MLYCAIRRAFPFLLATTLAGPSLPIGAVGVPALTASAPEFDQQAINPAIQFARRVLSGHRSSTLQESLPQDRMPEVASRSSRLGERPVILVPCEEIPSGFLGPAAKTLHIYKALERGAARRLGADVYLALPEEDRDRLRGLPGFGEEDLHMLSPSDLHEHPDLRVLAIVKGGWWKQTLAWLPPAPVIWISDAGIPPTRAAADAQAIISLEDHSRWIFSHDLDEALDEVASGPAAIEAEKRRLLINTVPGPDRSIEDRTAIASALFHRTLAIGYPFREELFADWLKLIGSIPRKHPKAYPEGIVFIWILHPGHVSDSRGRHWGRYAIAKVNADFESDEQPGAPRLLLRSESDPSLYEYLLPDAGYIPGISFVRASELRPSDVVIVPIQPLSNRDFVIAQAIAGLQNGSWWVPNLTTGYGSFVNARAVQEAVGIPAFHDGHIGHMRATKRWATKEESVKGFVLGPESEPNPASDLQAFVTRRHATYERFFHAPGPREVRQEHLRQFRQAHDIEPLLTQKVIEVVEQAAKTHPSQSTGIRLYFPTLWERLRSLTSKPLREKINAAQRVPAWHLVKMLGMENPDKPKGATVIRRQPVPGLGWIRRVKLRREGGLENDLSVLGRELGPVTTFDLVYDTWDRLIAIFPAVDAAHIPPVAPGGKPMFRYMDLSPYYIDLPQTDMPGAAARWQGLDESMARDRALIDRYSRDNEVPDSVWLLTPGNDAFTRSSPDSVKSYLEIAPDATLKPFAPKDRDRSAAAGVVVPLFPTVPAAAEGRREMEDSGFYKHLTEKGAGITGSAFFNLRPGHSVLVGFCRSGIEVLLAARATGGRIHAFDPNPFAVAGVRAMAASLGLDVRVALARNLGDAHFRRFYGEQRFDRIVADMPVYFRALRGETPRRKRSLRDWNIDLGGTILSSFADALEGRLQPYDGEAFLRNGDHKDVAQILVYTRLSVTEQTFQFRDRSFARTALYFLKAKETAKKRRRPTSLSVGPWEASAYVAHRQALARRLDIETGSRVASIGPGGLYRLHKMSGYTTELLEVEWERLFASLGAAVTIFEPNAWWLWRQTVKNWGTLAQHIIVPARQHAAFGPGSLAPASLDAVVIMSVLSDPGIPVLMRQSIALAAMRSLQAGGHLIVGWFNGTIAMEEAEWARTRHILNAAIATGFSLTAVDSGSDLPGILRHKWIAYEVTPIDHGPTSGTRSARTSA